MGVIFGFIFGLGSSRTVRVTLCVWPSGERGRIQQQTFQFIYCQGRTPVHKLP